MPECSNFWKKTVSFYTTEGVSTESTWGRLWLLLPWNIFRYILEGYTMPLCHKRGTTTMKLSLLQCALCRFNTLSTQEHYTWESPPRTDSNVFRLTRFFPDSPATSQGARLPKVPCGWGRTKEFPVIRGQMLSIAVYIKLLKAMSLATSVSDPRDTFLVREKTLYQRWMYEVPPPHFPSLPLSSPPSLCVCMYV